MEKSKFIWKILVKFIDFCNFASILKDIHNKDYSVVKTSKVACGLSGVHVAFLYSHAEGRLYPSRPRWSGAVRLSAYRAMRVLMWRGEMNTTPQDDRDLQE